MTSELWQKVQRILEAVLDLEIEERPAYLDEACGADEELRQEVESLLETAAEASEFTLDPVLTLRSDSRELERIGPYKVLRVIGRGGMGKVLQAVRADDEFEKIVAIKVLKRDMDTAEVARRFRHERQILANLAHPNIAELFDGGTTENGLPYFVMEYVEGVPVDRYCDDHRLGIRGRLELFRKICSAVHFAHQGLVVHRDLKPGNILVNEDGEPKLLDFGIAKLLDTDVPASETTASRLTATGIEPMTPDYASPEQIRAEAITTGSDVYSLGVLLFKILTGHRPYRLRSRAVTALFHAITDEDPSRPSDVIFLEEEVRGPDGSKRVLTLESVSYDRRLDPRALKRRLTGDIDAILQKALRKEPPNRYGSVEQFAEDIRRHLEAQPVVARKGTVFYQTTKFVRRHSLRLAVVAAIMMMIFFGVGAIISANQAERERQVAQSLSDLFATLQKLDPRAGEDPGFAARLRREVAQNIDDLKIADVLNEEATMLETRGGFVTAENLYREACEMGIRLFGKEHPDVARYINNLATAMEAQGKYSEAETLYREAVDLRIQMHGKESDETARTLNNLGALLQNMGEVDAAESYLRESLEIRYELYAPDSARVGVALNNFAFFQQARGDYQAAEDGFRQALSIFRTHFGLEHQNVGTVLRNLAALLTLTGDHENAEKTARQALAIFNKSLKHWKVADAESVVGGALAALGSYDEAEPLLRDSYTVISATKGSNARQTREALRRLEQLEEARRKSDAASQ